MKKIIRILEAQKVDGSFLRVAPFALADYRKESHGNLTQLCRGKENLMASVVVGVIGLYATKRVVKMCKKDAIARKNDPRNFGRELKKYWDSIERVYRLDNSIDCKSLVGKAVDYLSGKLKPNLSHDLKEAKKEYKAAIQQIIGAVLANTRHKEDAVHRCLAAFLNSIGYTTLHEKEFTRQNIQSIIK